MFGAASVGKEPALLRLKRPGREAEAAEFIPILSGRRQVAR